MIDLAIVVPCYNEDEVINETSSRLLILLNKLIENAKISKSSFVLFVNDGSDDKTWDTIETLHKSNKIFNGINLSHNVGHQRALLAGLSFIADKCDAGISIDADLQDDISVVEDMVDNFSDGCDIVYGVRNSRKTDTFFKRRTALAFYKLMSLLGVETVYNHADYRLMSSRALQALLQYKEHNIFLRGIVPLLGYKTAKVYYDRNERFAGKSKYPFRKMLNFALDGITSFSVKPLRLIMAIGCISLSICIISFVYIMISYIGGDVIQGWTSIMLSLWFIGSLIIISLGIIGEYIGKIYTEVKARPMFNIEKILF
jgi:glycosyltransferase involved in cell wall biosynthesis